jgi:hypothetical protein
VVRRSLRSEVVPSTVRKPADGAVIGDNDCEPYAGHKSGPVGRHSNALPKTILACSDRWHNDSGDRRRLEAALDTHHGATGEFSGAHLVEHLGHVPDGDVVHDIREMPRLALAAERLPQLAAGTNG